MALWEGAMGGSLGGQFRVRGEILTLSQDAANNRSLIRYTIFVDRITSGSRTWSGSSNTGWNRNQGYVTHWGAGSYDSTGAGRVKTIGIEDYWIYHDANGNLSLFTEGYWDALNSPYLTSGGFSGTTGITRLAKAPTGIAKSVDQITAADARLGAYQASHGHGTSSANRNYYRLNNTGGWSQTADNSGTGWKYRTVSLTSNSMYGYFSRHWNNNGDTADTSVSTFVTLPAACTAGTFDVLATTAQATISQNTGNGYYSITRQYRYRIKDGTWGDWTTLASTTLSLSGLLPNTTYEVQLRSTTTAGTSTNATTYEFTTLPAGKLVYPDGSVKNAITRLVYPDATPTTMVNINLVREE